MNCCESRVARPAWLYVDHLAAYSIRHRPHLLQVALKHYAPAFLDEQYPIVIDVTNVDTRPLDVVLDVLLQPTEIDEAGTYGQLSTIRFSRELTMN